MIAKKKSTHKMNKKNSDIFKVFIRFLTSKNDLTKDRHLDETSLVLV